MTVSKSHGILEKLKYTVVTRLWSKSGINKPTVQVKHAGIMPKKLKKKSKVVKKSFIHYSGDVSQSIKINIYATTSGKEPFSEWLDLLDRSVRGQVEARIDRLEQGNFGNAKALKDGLFELKFKSPAFRVYYAEIGKEIILLISGGDKTRQSDDIDKAKDYLADYRSRYGSKKKS